MARRRFLVDSVRNNRAELRGGDARHLARVLRAEPAARYEISDGTQVYLAQIETVEPERVIFSIVEPLQAAPLPVHLTLLAGLIKFDRFEWLVEKATEAGVSAIVPVACARTDKGLPEAAVKRVERWRRIARESSQQSRRVSPPEILQPLKLADALTHSASARYLLDEAPGQPPLWNAVTAGNATAIALLTGPEGGWTAAERSSAESAGWTAVSLGPLVMRAETAAIAASAITLHACWATSLE